MKCKSLFVCLFLVLAISLNSPVFARGGTEGHPGKVSGKSVGAAALSLLIWPGLGQVILDNPYEKNATHAVLGITQVFRFWSAYDAFVDRSGGVWHNRI